MVGWAARIAVRVGNTQRECRILKKSRLCIEIVAGAFFVLGEYHA